MPYEFDGFTTRFPHDVDAPHRHALLRHIDPDRVYELTTEEWDVIEDVSPEQFMWLACSWLRRRQQAA